MTLEEARSDRIETSVIYIIKNTINSKGYVGSTNLFWRRAGSHLSDLKRGIHHSGHLQAAWDKYGGDAFDIEVIDRCVVSALLLVEQEWLDKTEYYKRSKGYNMRREVDRPPPMSPGERVALSKKVVAGRRLNTVERVILDPDGNRVKFKLISDLCRERGLDSCSICSVLGGKLRHHKGWQLPMSLRPAEFQKPAGAEVQFIRPDGFVEKIYDLTKYCKDHNLTYQSMYLVCSGKQWGYMGYRALNWEAIKKRAEANRVPRKEFVLYSPAGEKMEFKGVTATSSELGLSDRGAVRCLLNGQQTHAKGWYANPDKAFKIFSPEGKCYNIVSYIWFARHIGLEIDLSELSHKGVRSHHGWCLEGARCIWTPPEIKRKNSSDRNKVSMKSFILEKDGVETSHTGIKETERQLGLKKNGFRDLRRGVIKNHHGYTFVRFIK